MTASLRSQIRWCAGVALAAATGMAGIPSVPAAAPCVGAAIEVVHGGADNLGQHASLRFNPDTGRLVVAYYNASSGDLCLATSSAGPPWTPWTRIVVDTVRDVGRYASLSIDAAGRHNLGYYDATEGALKYAGWVAVAWSASLENVTTGGDDLGTYAQLRLEPTGNLAVAFYDATMGQLLYGVKAGTWSLTTVDALRDVGRYVSLAIDATGQRNLAYYDADEGALKYAGWVAPDWSVALEQVHSGQDDVGQYATAKLDLHHFLTVVYYNASQTSLMYARRVYTPAGWLWVQETIDNAGDVGRYCSLAAVPSPPIPSAEYQHSFHVSYFDDTNTALKGVIYGGPDNLTPVDDTQSTPSLPMWFALHGNAPNPFNPVTTVSFDLPAVAAVRLVIYDAAGRRIRTLVDAPLPAGRHELKWDGTGDNGRPVASGVYLCRMEAGAFSETRRMALVR